MKTLYEAKMDGDIKQTWGELYHVKDGYAVLYVGDIDGDRGWMCADPGCDGEWSE